MNTKSTPDLILHKRTNRHARPGKIRSQKRAIKDGRIVGVDDAEATNEARHEGNRLKGAASFPD
jgi:hypothetical protein